MALKNWFYSLLMIPPINTLPPGKKIFFASDFHLGVPNKEASRDREKKIVRWLESIENEAEAIFILGDIFDFWFEYKHLIPKGFIRLQGKLAFLKDNGIPIYFFTGNHDMWMFDYFPQELGIPVFREPQTLKVGNHTLMIGHGDGLGPGDHFYKFLKKIFANKLCQMAFSVVPGTIGMGIANYWSKNSRLSNNKREEKFLNEQEWLFQYCKDMEAKIHFDYYIFGHRHLPLEMEVSATSKYINLGEWVNYFTYASFDGSKVTLEKFSS
jgi:UDP-2,3-diacylglucosamine hydrolase